MPESKYYGGITRRELDQFRKDLAKESITVPKGDDVEEEKNEETGEKE